MSIVILHHHLFRGGVTTIIRSQIDALRGDRRDRVRRILSGAHCDDGRRFRGVPVVVDPTFNYLSPPLPPDEVLREKLDNIENVLCRHVNKGDILHVHNASLGKNPLVNLAVYQRALAGQRVCYHCHDFAEDGRFENYRSLRYVVEKVFRRPLPEVQYPRMTNVHFVVINSRDQQHLKRAGLSETQITILHNPITAPAKTVDRSTAAPTVREALEIDDELPIIVYPVRGIRRKNIGEFVLLAALFRNRAHWLVTLRPKNPIESESYDRWVRFSKRMKIPVRFSVGERLPFDLLMAAASKSITTSICEGFGMGFLEPWLYGIPVVGRRLPHIRVDFKQSGLQLSGLYDRLDVPLRSPIRKSELEKKYVRYILSAYKSLGERVPSRQEIGSQVAPFLRRRWIDFGCLDLQTQQRVIGHAVGSRSYRLKLLERNRLERKLLSRASVAVIAENKRVIRRAFGLGKYSSELSSVYAALKNRTPSTLNGLLVVNPLVEAFLRTEEIRLIRS